MSIDSASPAPPHEPPSGMPGGGSYKWWAFTAIGISFFTQVMSMSMVFVALSSIADEFGITLRAVTWVVVVQVLTISALMMPMGRLADMIGRRKVHLGGLLMFGGGAVLVALAPTFELMIAAQVVMAIGNAAGQSVGTAMVISVFPASERGNAIGSQTTAVAVGGASGPIVAGLVLQFLPWQALFWMITVPIVVAFIAGYLILDDARMNQFESADRPPFDWGGALLSSVAIVLLVITINNPLVLPWLSPAMLGSAAAVVMLLALFARWEFRNPSPMLQLRMFRNGVFSMAVAARYFGFMGATATRFLAPIYLISLRGLGEGAAGGVLFLISLGMAIAAQGSGRMSDRFGSRPFAVFGFAVLLVTAISMVFVTGTTAMWIVMLILFVNGLGMGLWNVPNNAVIMGSVPSSSFGVVGALTNLVRNVGNVTGQALASTVVVAVMVSAGFDIPLSEIRSTAGAGDAFVDGWRVAYLLVSGFAAISLVLAAFTKPAFERRSTPIVEPVREPVSVRP
ncbi:MAG: MFS transporter [Chloroflexi bacterium]|nr:MFS transporter [Chloroflexota bacterium]MDA1145690.1 MFS transporter [Chloroflexota bacterium]